MAPALHLPKRLEEPEKKWKEVYLSADLPDYGYNP
jgi:hypothetical protein